MYLKRKIDKILEAWLSRKKHSPALISGIRQCGKTRSINEFAEKHFGHVIYIDFWKNAGYKNAFSGPLEVDLIIERLSFENSKFLFVPGDTVIILDEIQDCPQARLSLKSFKEDGRFEVIASGSFLGLNLDTKKTNGTPKPNGSEDVFHMTTMDFEEFAWSMGYSEKQMEIFENCFREKRPIDMAIHEKMKRVFSNYLVLGGYPEVVSLFIEEHNFSVCFQKLQSLIFDIKGDPSKRIDSDGKPLYSMAEIARIQNAFDLVPSFLMKENKRYVVSKINGGSGTQKSDAVTYLANSSIVLKVNNVSNLSMPLIGGKNEADFKLFFADIGLLIGVSGFETMKALALGKTGVNSGYVYESVVAESLYKAGVPLFYFRKDTGLEIDFVIEYDAMVRLVEAKARNGNAKSSKMVLGDPKRYGETSLIKIGNYNISLNQGVLTLPHYLTYLLGRNSAF